MGKKILILSAGVLIVCLGLLFFPFSTPPEGSAAKYAIVDNAIDQSLTGQVGDPRKGRALAMGRKKGNCLACHEMPIPEADDHGRIGPALYDVASRLSAGEIRLRIVDPKQVNPHTIMPAFHKTEGLHRVLEKFQGKTILTAREVEDVVAYLGTLKQPH